MFVISFFAKRGKTITVQSGVSFFIDIFRNKNKMIENVFQYCQFSDVEIQDKHNGQVDVHPCRCRRINNVTSVDYS